MNNPGAPAKEKILLQKLDAAFRSTCRSTMGSELGGLEELKGFLTSTAPPPTARKSALSSKEVFLYYSQYPKKGKFIADSESPLLPPPKLSINEIKDIDSLLSAAKENFAYCGDKHLGKNFQVSSSDGIIDCGFINETNAAYNSQYSCYSDILLNSKYIFGCTYSAFCNFMVKSYHNYLSSRFFQSGYSHTSSDLHFCWRMEFSQECLFSMNQVNARCMIGNLPLPREEYFSLKQKLLGEIALEIRNKKSFPTIFELAGGGAK